MLLLVRIVKLSLYLILNRLIKYINSMESLTQIHMKEKEKLLCCIFQLFQSV